MKQLWLVTLFCLASGVAYAEIKRTESGKPDLSGFYDSGTLTPLNRPEELGEKQFMTREEADEITARTRAFLSSNNEDSDPDREAPVLGGGAVKTGGGGGTGGYNSFWLDLGDDVVEINGKIRRGDSRPVRSRRAPRPRANPRKWGHAHRGRPAAAVGGDREDLSRTGVPHRIRTQRPLALAARRTVLRGPRQRPAGTG